MWFQLKVRNQVIIYLWQWNCHQIITHTLRAEDSQTRTFISTIHSKLSQMLQKAPFSRNITGQKSKLFHQLYILWTIPEFKKNIAAHRNWTNRVAKNFNSLLNNFEKAETVNVPSSAKHINPFIRLPLLRLLVTVKIGCDVIPPFSDVILTAVGWKSGRDWLVGPVVCFSSWGDSLVEGPREFSIVSTLGGTNINCFTLQLE